MSIKGLSRVFSNATVQKHQFFGAQLSLQSNSYIHSWPLEKPYPLLFSHSVMSDSLWPHVVQHTRLPCPSLLPELAQIQVHWVSDAIQPSHPLPSPFLPAFYLSQHQGLFQWLSSSHQVAKVFGALASVSVLPMNIQHWFPLGLTGLISLQSKGL